MATAPAQAIVGRWWRRPSAILSVLAMVIAFGRGGVFDDQGLVDA